MQRAAAGLAYAIADFLGYTYGRRILLLVGAGDNGGDALFAGAMLARRGAQVDALPLADQVHQAGLAALKAAGGSVVDEPGAPELVVDGIVGIGGTPGLREAAVVALNKLSGTVPGVPVLAVDLPSGVSVDDGRIDGPHVTADVTVTFGTHKICHLVEPAAGRCGAVHLVDIGLDLPTAPIQALQAVDVAGLLPRPLTSAHKYTRGVVGVRAGSATYPGAALLCVAGASTGLAGMVRYVGSADEMVKTTHPEVVGDGQAQSWVVGPGGDQDSSAELAAAISRSVPVVVDATALAHLDGPLDVPAVLTPHAGELAAMLSVTRAEVEAEGLRYAREGADRFDAVVLLKGPHTLIVEPASLGGRVRVTTVGPPWLATAGAGDVLAGLIGALLAAGLDPFDAASVGSWVHGAAGAACGDGPVVAGRVAEAIPGVCRSLLALR